MGHISNYDSLATTQLRRDALAIVESAYEAIDTDTVMRDSCRVEGSELVIGEKRFDLDHYEHVYVIGIGKASCTAAAVLEELLPGRIKGGVVIDKHVGKHGLLETFQGTHPVATAYNVELTEKVVALAEKAGEKDLVLVIVSGGGSSLLCYPMSEYKQGKVLYERFLSTGGTITELNTLRKHVSLVKGGGLAKMLYPATVVGLIFSDIPSSQPENAYKLVASGPTYKDETTTDDAKALLKKYGIDDVFTFTETPKKDIYFEKVTNIPMLSNMSAVHALERKAKELGYDAIILNTGEYREASLVLADMKAALKQKTAVIVAGEPSVIVKHSGDISGRSEYAAAKALSIVEEGQLCIPFATDGIDNKSEAAGALVDGSVVRSAKEKADVVEELMKEEQFDEIFKALDTRIMTGPTGSNVSDCIIFMQE